MGWQVRSTVELRHEFVLLADQEGANMTQLCQRFGISRPTGYLWLERYRRDGMAGLEERPRTPQHSPTRTPPAVETAVLAVREAHPTWGGRKIRAVLERQGLSPLPSASTITAILRRHDRLDPAESVKHRSYQRFEAGAPNDLWQLDFKGHLALEEGRVHPLTILDDHSRFLLGLGACGDEQGETVQLQLQRCFVRYGLPRCILSDNGPPWGAMGQGGWSGLEVWLWQLGIEVWHGRPAHPQTQGKVERVHRTLKAEVFGGAPYRDLATCQQACDAWRQLYNTERPHEALGMAVPAARYQPSPRCFPRELPVVVYGPEDVVRTVKPSGYLAYQGHRYWLSKGLRGHQVALRRTADPQVMAVYFGTHHLQDVDLVTDRDV